MYLLSHFVLFISYFDLDIAFDEEFFFNSSEFLNNGTVLERGLSIIFHTPALTNTTPATDHAAVQIVIFAACIILVLIIGLILCSICCKHYRRDRALLVRSPSLNSIQELIRERLLDRPPSYHESQTHINIYQIDDPPSYNEVTLNTNLRTTETTANSPIISTETIGNSSVRVPTSPPVYTISSKMSTTYANNDLDLPFTECESDTDSPPSYHTSEGVVNPILLHTTNNSSNENNIESNSERENQNLARHAEFYI